MAQFNPRAFYRNMARVLNGGPTVPKFLVNRTSSPGHMAGAPIGTATQYFAQSTNRLTSYVNQFNDTTRLARYCITGDMLVITNSKQGYLPMKELVERFESGEKIHAYAYDKENKEMVCVPVKKAWKTKRDQIWEIEFDDGLIVRCTGDHRIMLRDGSYKEAQHLRAKDAVMPFTRKSFFTEDSHIRGSYRLVYCHKRGWVTEHKLVMECVEGTKDWHSTHHVHHRNFTRDDNSIDNLQLMLAEEHLAYHAHINNKRFEDPEQRKRQSEIAKKRWSSEGDLRIRQDELSEKRKNHPNYLQNCTKASERLKGNKYGIKNAGRQDQGRFDNANADTSFTFQDICNVYTPGMSLQSLVKTFGCNQLKIMNRLHWEGYSSYTEFKNTYSNHKVVRVTKTEKFEDVYDLTIDKYHNFAVGNHIKPNNELKHPSAISACIISNSDYGSMEQVAEIASALDIYASESTTRDEYGQILKIKSEDPNKKEILNDLFYKTLNIEFNAMSWIRALCKYGDYFLLLDHHPDFGVIGVIPLPVNEIEREEGYDPKNPTAHRFRWRNNGNKELQSWEVLHFRMTGNDAFMPYGMSCLEPARRAWRQLLLLEDAVMVYRIVRAPERRVFRIDVGNIAPNDVPALMNKARDEFKRNQVLDPNTNRIDQRFNALSVTDDYFIPVRGTDSATSIDTLPGGNFVGDIEDLQYIQNKVFAALKVPKSYLGFESDLSGKSTLSQLDSRFARTIQNIQAIFLAELYQVAITQLYSKGYRDDDLFDFELEMTNPSNINEIQRLELWRQRFEVASVATGQDGVLDKTFIYKEIFGLNDQEIEVIEEGRRKDKLFQLEIDGMQLPMDPSMAGAEGLEGADAAGGLGGAGAINPEAGEDGSVTDNANAPLDANGPAEPSAPAATGESRDPNIQRAIPNDMLGNKGKKRKKVKDPSLVNLVYNQKKNSLDPKHVQGILRRVATAPFGESDNMMHNQTKLLHKHAEVIKNAEALTRKPKKIL